jgi:hypothetical protein
MSKTRKLTILTAIVTLLFIFGLNFVSTISKVKAPKEMVGPTGDPYVNGPPGPPPGTN